MCAYLLYMHACMIYAKHHILTRKVTIAEDSCGQIINYLFKANCVSIDNY